MTPGVTPNIGAFENDSSDPGVTEASGSERPSSVGSALESTWLEAGFEILDLIGHGGMGVVFKARQLSLDRIVALKVLIAGQHASPTQRARFHLEAESIAQLQHPNVIQIYESGTNKSELFFSMEYCSGGSLADFIHEEKISASEAARIVLLLAEAVQTAHARGIIHRDIKPSNVLLLDDNERPISQRKPKLTDFGIAKNLQTQSGITQSGDVIGTPAYMAPEQAMGRVHSIGPATDIYAIGAILYQLLTGTPPFEAASSMETLSRVMRDDPVLPSRLTGHAIPKDLEVICLKCLEKNPEQRYVSAEALAEDLRCYLDHRPIQARPVSTFTRLAKWVKRHPVKTVVALGSLITTVLILGLLIGFFYQSKLKTSNEQLASTLNKLEQERQRAQRYLYGSQLSLAGKAWSEGHVFKMKRLLANQIPKEKSTDFRGFEWYHLNALMNRGMESIQADTDMIRTVACSPDRKWIASGGRTQILKLWDRPQKKLVHAIKGFRGAIHHLCFTKDSARIISADTDQMIRAHEVKTGKLIHEWNLPNAGLRDRIRGFALDGTGKRLVVIVDTGDIHAFSVLTGKLELSMRTKQVPESVAHHPTKDQIALTTLEGTVETWDLKTKKSITWALANPRGPSQIAYSRDGRWLVCGGSNGSVSLWDSQDLTFHFRLSGHTHRITAVDYHPDGFHVLSSSADGTLMLWDLREKKLAETLRGHVGHVMNAVFSSDGEQIISCGHDGVVALWPTSYPSAKLERNGGERIHTWIEFIPDTRKFLLACSGGVIEQWDADTGMREQSWNVHRFGVVGLAISADARWIASCDVDSELIVMDRNDPKKRRNLTGHQGLIHQVRFHPNKPEIAACTRDRIYVWDVISGRLLRTLELPRDAHRLLYDGSGERMVIACRDFVVRVLDAQTGKVIDSEFQRHRSHVDDLAISRDGRYLASASRDRRILVHDLTTGERLHTLDHHTGPVSSVVFSPDGERLISTGVDGTILIQDLITGQELVSLPTQSVRPSLLAISSDGASLVHIPLGSSVLQIRKAQR